MSEQTGPDSAQNSPSRALVAVSPRNDASPARLVMPEAGFLAQIMACGDGTAAYRKHRREQPGLATGLYRACMIGAAQRDVPARPAKLGSGKLA